MLQIISGKFFKSDDLHVSDCKGITYSNISWIGKIETSVATLEPVETFRGVSSYVIVYQNKIEKLKTKFQIVKIGDTEIIEQFQYLLTFCFQAFFNIEKSYVMYMCREKAASQSDYYVPSQYTNRFFNPIVHLKNYEIDNFKFFIDKVLGLKRDVYKKIINCLSIFSHSLEILNYNIDLSYSMLIFALETLAQSFDKFKPNWVDIDLGIRTKLDKEFEDIDDEKVKRIKNIYLEEKHLKLTKRFLEFISNNINDTYFFDSSQELKNPLKKSDVDQALRNAYDFRSKFSHQLNPILKQLKTEVINQFDVYSWDNKPYLTYRGLLRLTHHVISQFIMKQEKIDKEDYDWTKDIPGTMQMEVAPEYWVTLHENFQEPESNKRLSGFLSLLIGTFNGVNKMCDFNALLEKYEELIPQSKKNNRLSMLTLYYLYNEIVPENVRRPNYIEFINKHEKELLEPNIQSIILHTIIDDDFPYDIDNALETYEKYCTKKYSKNELQVPIVLEIAIIIKIANKFYETGNIEKYHELYNKAVLDLPNFSDLQNKIQNANKNEISFNVNDIFRPNIKQDENNNKSVDTLY